MKKELFFSVDIESNGPTPGLNSMLSFGAVAIEASGKVHGEFIANLLPLPGTEPDPAVTEWWRQQSTEALAALTSPEPESAPIVMSRFIKWVKDLIADQFKPVFAAWPAVYDLPFVAYYAMTQAGFQPVRHTYCLKSAAATLFGFSLIERGAKKYLPKHWSGGVSHNHTALGDAREQAQILVHLLETAKRLRERI